MRPRHAQRGFTLTELLVVIGIIAALAGILIPMAVKAYWSAEATRTRSDLNAIGVALSQYNADFGDYPRVTLTDGGADVLGLALMGPGPDVQQPYSGATTYSNGSFASNAGVDYGYINAAPTSGNAPPNTTYWQALYIPYWDGAIGPGFRIRASGVVHPPYLAADKVRMKALDFVDRDGHAILYFAGNPKRPNITASGLPGGGYVHRIASDAPKAASMYDSFDNYTALGGTGNNAGYMMTVMLGDTNGNGYIQPTYAVPEEPKATGPYILWAAGSDGTYGFTGVNTSASAANALANAKLAAACDDIIYAPN